MEVSNKVAQSLGKQRQFIAAIILNLACLSLGLCMGWSSPFTVQLSSSNPPIGDAPMTNEQIAWMTSFPPIGSLLAITFCSALVERLGRKRFALLAGLPHIVAWLLVLFSRSHIYLYVSRGFVGAGGAMTFFIVPLYIGEIASEEIRGMLGSLFGFALNVGVLLGYVFGVFLSFRAYAIASLMVPLIFIGAFSLMPETPVHLVRRNLECRARESLMFFRGDNRAVVEQELLKLRSLAKTSDGSSSNTTKVSDLFKDRATRKAMIISCGLLAGQQLSGIIAVMSYAQTIFTYVGSSISAEAASITIAAMQIVGSYASTTLVERAGRRLLILVSCLGMTVGHATVALFFYLQVNQYNVAGAISWLPLVAISTYIVAHCLGIGPLPFVVVSEVFAPSVACRASTACFLFYLAAGFVAIRAFDLATEYAGAHGCFLMLASFCAASWAFTYCLLPETKGREREDIVDELAGVVGREKCDAAAARGADVKTLIDSVDA